VTANRWNDLWRWADARFHRRQLGSVTGCRTRPDPQGRGQHELSRIAGEAVYAAEKHSGRFRTDVVGRLGNCRQDGRSSGAHGEPVHQGGTAGCPAGMDCTGTYRSMLTDAVSFGSSLTFSIEHGSVDEVQADYSSTAYWYGRSTYTEKLTDTLDIGNLASEQAHGYSSPDLDE
jgi:hypothetical protein